MNAQTQPIADTPITAPSLAIRSAGLIFGTGVGITLGGTLVRSLFAAANSPPLPTNMLLVFTITHLITVIPMGIVASKVGNQRSMLVAIGAIAVSLVLFSIVYSNPFSLGLVLIWGIAWSAIANGIIPYALSLVPPAKAGLGIGLFFGGGSFAITSVGILIRQIGTLSSLTSILGAAIAFLLAGCFIALSPKVRKE
jgi:hypothetical protein